MAPNILTAVTAEQLRYEPELGVYIELVIETGFDPEALWYPCPCPYAHDGQHEDRCWLGWIAYPQWMREETGEVPIIVETPYTDVDLDVAHALAAFYSEEPDDSIDFEQQRALAESGGWCAPADTMSWCGHPLSANCGCTVDAWDSKLDLRDLQVASVERWIGQTLAPGSGASEAEVRFARDLREVKERKLARSDVDTDLDEDETLYHERHDTEPTSDEGDDDAGVHGEPDEHADDDDHGRS